MMRLTPEDLSGMTFGGSDFDDLKTKITAFNTPDMGVHIVDRIGWLIAYAQIAGDRDAEIRLANLRLRAMRRLGELLSVGSDAPGFVLMPEFAEHCRRLSSVPSRTFESILTARSKDMAPATVADFAIECPMPATEVRSAKSRRPPPSDDQGEGVDPGNRFLYGELYAVAQLLADRWETYPEAVRDAFPNLVRRAIELVEINSHV